MRKTLLILAIAAGVMLLPNLAQTPAEAGVFWSIGSVFSVGGLDFALAFGRPAGYFGVQYGDGYFFRTARPLHYGGYSCHAGCSYRAGYYYHHPDCSVVHYHFRRYRFVPRVHLSGAPWYYGSHRHYDRYRSPSRYPRSYRYDRYRYDRYRYDRYRYDQHRPQARGDRYRFDRRSRGYRDWDHDSDSDSDRGRRDRGRGRDSWKDSQRHDRSSDGYRPNSSRNDQRRAAPRRQGRDTRSRGGRQ